MDLALRAAPSRFPSQSMETLHEYAMATWSEVFSSPSAASGGINACDRSCHFDRRDIGGFVYLSSQAAMAFTTVAALLCFTVGGVALLFIPHQIRDRKLRKRGADAEAVCEERLYRGGLSVVRVRCVFSPRPGIQVRALVTPPRPAPRVGETLTVVYDTENPEVVESAHYLRSSAPRAGVVFQLLFVVSALATVIGVSLS